MFLVPYTDAFVLKCSIDAAMARMDTIEATLQALQGRQDTMLYRLSAIEDLLKLSQFSSSPEHYMSPTHTNDTFSTLTPPSLPTSTHTPEPCPPPASVPRPPPGCQPLPLLMKKHKNPLPSTVIDKSKLASVESVLRKYSQLQGADNDSL